MTGGGKSHTLKIALFESGLPNCAHDAGSTAVVDLCLLAQAAGHTVEYVYTGHNPWGRTEDLQSRRIAFHAMRGETSAFLRARAYDVAICSRPGPAMQWLLPCQVHGLKMVYFGHDIHHRRLERGNAVLAEPQRMPARDIAAMRALERHIWRACAAAIYPSEEECRIVREAGQPNAHALPIYDLEATHAAYKRARARALQMTEAMLFFAGGAHHQPNDDAMRWFLAEILPKIRTRCRLHIAGDWPEAFRRAHPQAVFLGRLPQEGLFAAYRAASLVIAPLRYGAGVKRKVVEALALEKPVLSTPIGFEGVELEPALAALLCVEPQADAFARRVDMLLESQPQTGLARQSEALLARYCAAYRKQVFEKVIASL